jgi:hypothetical protein
MCVTTTSPANLNAAAVERLVANARRLGKGAHHVAAAAHFALPGARVLALCCWCVERHDAGREAPAPVYRLPCGGECERCPYVGPDCLVVED